MNLSPGLTFDLDMESVSALISPHTQAVLRLDHCVVSLSVLHFDKGGVTMCCPDVTAFTLTHGQHIVTHKAYKVSHNSPVLKLLHITGVSHYLLHDTKQQKKKSFNTKATPT